MASNRVCANCSECPSGTVMTAACNATVDTECEPTGVVACGRGSIRVGPVGASVCVACNACPAGQYPPVRASSSLRCCCASLTPVSVWTHGRSPTPLRPSPSLPPLLLLHHHGRGQNCPSPSWPTPVWPGHDLLVWCSLVQDGPSCTESGLFTQPTCVAWSVCGTGLYEAAAGTGTTDRLCRACRRCETQTSVAGACNATDDTVCAPWPAWFVAWELCAFVHVLVSTVV